MMQPSPQPASSILPVKAAGSAPSRGCEEYVYQAVTIASILLVLVSVWVF